jgi:protein-tyrosine phosphatase
VSSPQAPRILFLCSGNYYRSRFAEHLFNHLVEATSLPHRAESAGLMHDCRSRNHGPISKSAVEALVARGVVLPRAHRDPRDVCADDIVSAALVIALKESEHRPLVLARFPDFLDRFEFWQVDDIPIIRPEVALPMIEENVRALIARLLSSSAPVAGTPSG